MSEGYYIVEPRSIDLLLRSPQLHGIAASLEQWAIDQVLTTLAVSQQNIEVKILSVSYYGPYPAIGIKGASQEVTDNIEKCINDILSHTIISNFVEYLAGANRGS